MHHPHALDRRGLAVPGLVASGRVASGRVALVAAALALAGCTAGTPQDAPATEAPRPGLSEAPSPSASSASASPTPSPLLATTALAGGMTEVVADPAFLEALERLGVAPRVAGQAGFAGATGTFSFPVTGGSLTVAPDGRLRGDVRHAGSGLRLTSGTSTVALDDLVLDADEGVVRATAAVDGAVRAEDAPVLVVDDAGLLPPDVDEATGATVLRGLRVGLSAQGAELLNSALAPEGFAPGTPFGTATLTLEPAAG